MTTRTTTLFAAGLTAIALATACASRESEYIAALPDRDTVLVKIPEAQSMQGLTAATSNRALVGQPADLYTSSYYSARGLNAIVGFVILIVEKVTATRPSGIDDHQVVWGPFSDRNEPNEFILNVTKHTGADVHYEWRIAGKHKSEGDDAYVTLAGGAFQPELEDHGHGWFAIDFDTIRTLNPTENGRGKISFAFSRGKDGVSVLAHYDGPDASGAQIAASYAYGEDPAGEGFVVFAFPTDIDHGKDGKIAAEDVLIRTRWKANGGRADIVAVHGDLGASVAQGSQCWNHTFVSTYESIKVDGRVLGSSGDATGCVFEEAKLPAREELPGSNEVRNPFQPSTP